MPFKSSSQMRAAFGGYLGPEMQAKAKTWAAETPDIKSLPSHVAQRQSRRESLLKHMKGTPHGPAR
jgi:hypothetical protein